MRLIVPDYYKNFKCIAGDCKDSCCAGWEVDVDEKAQEYYVTVDGEFGKRLKDSTIIDEDGIRFTLTKDKRCCFLNDCNLCDLYTALGEEHLCDTCTDFPRFNEVFGNLMEKGTSLSCPTAAGLILRHDEKLTFDESEIDEELEYNDLDYDLYMELSKSRQLVYEIIQNRDKDINWRIAITLIMANDIQKAIDKGKYKKIAKIREKYEKEDYCSKEFLKHLKKAMKVVDGNENLAVIINLFKNLEVVNKEWPDLLNKVSESLNNDIDDETFECYRDYFESREIQWEQIMMYFIYRYFMKAAYDEDLIGKVKMAVISFLVMKYVDRAIWLDKKSQDTMLTLDESVWLFHLYSKEIEHSDENMDWIAESSSVLNCFHIEALLMSLIV